MRRDFHTLDVFTTEKLAGNPLAVVLDCEGLDAARMQAIAREFNLSETVFVLAPKDPVNTAAVRIFTPGRELPFAGHPTVGAATLIAELRAGEMLRAQDVVVVLEEGVGPVRCTVRHDRDKGARASFELPRLPREIGAPPDPAAVARAVSLAPRDIGFDAHRPRLFSAGVGFTFVPVASLEAIGRARADLAQWSPAIGPADHANAFLYTRETSRSDSHFHARMFAPEMGVGEDPATGSAVAAFAGALLAAENWPDGEHALTIEQGFEMGRPSLITLGLEIAGGALTGASIGGHVTPVMRGVIDA